MLRVEHHVIPNKALGAAVALSKTFKLGANEFAKVLMASVTVVADATVGDRLPRLRQWQGIDAYDAIQIDSCMDSLGGSWPIANETWALFWSPGGSGTQTQFATKSGAIDLLQPIWSGEFQVEITVSNLQNGDQLNGGQIWVAIGKLDEVAFL